jgi:tetratricopeptide (TPR) repeat protein
VRSGRAAEAEPLLRENLRTSGEWLGDESSFYLADLIILEDALWMQGRRDDSLATYERLLEVAGRAHGTDSEMYLTVRSNYAGRLLEIGRMSEAEPILRELVAAESSRPDRGQEGLYANRYNLAELLYKTGRYDEALAMAESCRLKMYERFGADHLFTLVTDALTGACRVAAGKPREGAALLREALERQREILGENHPKTVETAALLAEVEEIF